MPGDVGPVPYPLPMTDPAAGAASSPEAETATDRELLAALRRVWWQAVNDFTELLEDVPTSSGRRRPTCPAGTSGPSPPTPPTSRAPGRAPAEETAEVGEPPHVTRADGPLHRAGRASPGATRRPTTLINEIRESTTARHTPLLADPPTDASAPARADLRRRRRGLADAAAQPAARRLDARAGRAPRGRPPGQPGLARRPGTPPTTSPRASATSLGKRAQAPVGTVVRARGGRAPAVRLRRRRGRARSAATPTPAEPDRDAAPWTARRSSVLAGGRRRAAEPGDVRRRPATPSSASGVVASLGDDPVTRSTPGDSPTSPTWPAAPPLVTGTTLGGLGHHTALELARRGARVVLAGRTPDELAETGRGDPRPRCPPPRLEPLVVDLSDLGSVRRGRRRQPPAFGPIDVLVNNAGVMGTAAAGARPTGSSSQLATNHFGPFLLTGLLLPQLAASAGTRRVVTRVVADAPRRPARAAGRPARAAGRYSRWHVYGQSKLANLLFTYELDRRLRQAGAAGPGAGRAPGLRRHPPRGQRPVRPTRGRRAADPRRARSSWSPSPPRPAPGRR